MFKSAKIKLTLWYLGIIMLITISFSVIIYQSAGAVGKRILYNQQNRTERHFDNMRGMPTTPSVINEQAVLEYRTQLFNVLLKINIGVLLFSGLLGYFLAGRTLKPIEEMVENQRRFISDAAHELKTPITSLKTELEVSLRDKKLDLNEAKNILESNLEDVDKLSNLTKALIAESRYEKNDNTVKFSQIELSEIIEEAIGRVEKRANQKNISIEKEIYPQLVKGDRISLVELTTIILDNSIKYSNKNTSIEIKLENESNKPVLKVSDHGIGIKESDIPYIFNRFYRADISRSKLKEDGFGLGLSIAKSIANLHNAKISISSEIGKGSTFKVTFPKNIVTKA